MKLEIDDGHFIGGTFIVAVAITIMCLALFGKGCGPTIPEPIHRVSVQVTTMPAGGSQ